MPFSITSHTVSSLAWTAAEALIGRKWSVNSFHWNVDKSVRILFMLPNTLAESQWSFSTSSHWKHTQKLPCPPSDCLDLLYSLPSPRISLCVHLALYRQAPFSLAGLINSLLSYSRLLTLVQQSKFLHGSIQGATFLMIYASWVNSPLQDHSLW